MPARNTRIYWPKWKNINTNSQHRGKPVRTGKRRRNETWKELKRGRRKVKWDENDKNSTNSSNWSERVAKKKTRFGPKGNTPCLKKEWEIEICEE